jgi:excisionase family DNA binding protein
MSMEQPTNEINQLLKATDVAMRLNISRSLAYQLMQSGDIPTVRISRSVRVLESDLEEFIQRCRSTPKLG